MRASPRRAPCRRRALLVALVALLITALAAPVAAAPPDQARNERELTVMSRNLYLGTDLTPLFAATSVEGLQAPLASRWQEVQDTDFTLRARALAGEIAAHRPHVVGLQEVSLWRSQSLATYPGGSWDVEHDFLKLLLDALADAGTPYREVTTVELFQGELPLFAIGRVLSLTDRQSILVRADAQRDGVTVQRDDEGVFDAALPLQIAGEPISVTRGWTAADLNVRGHKVRVVNTHFEAFDAGARFLQAQELLAGPLATERPTVLVGDVNSPAPAGDTYRLLLDHGGFTDAWSRLRPGEPGPTCCFDDDLRGGALRTRIDVIFFRGPFTPTAITRTGHREADRVGGLYPSDHAGVVATLRLPPPGQAGR
jgi:hypothetical protein